MNFQPKQRNKLQDQVCAVSIGKLEAEVSVYKTAAFAYSNALKKELRSEKNKKHHLIRCLKKEQSLSKMRLFLYAKRG